MLRRTPLDDATLLESRRLVELDDPDGHPCTHTGHSEMPTGFALAKEPCAETQAPKIGDASDYTLDEHRHRFAVWAAARAYSRGGSGGGYTLETARLVLEAAGVRDIRSVEDLPEPDQIDQFNDGLIHRVMAAAPPTYTADEKDVESGTSEKKKVEREFVCTYGRAQKLVNIYLKSKLICGSTCHDDIRLARLHPPLDRELLKALGRLARAKPAAPLHHSFKRLWDVAPAKGDSWTDFDKATYDAYVAAIKALQGGRPLWAVEEYWMNGK